MKNPWLCLVAIPLLGGCAAINTRAISYAQPGDRLFVWKSNYSAGMATRSGGICAQGALTANATSLEAGGSIGGGAAALANPALSTLAKEKLAEASLAQEQSVAMVNASNNQTAYANIAFFYLCQISLNWRERLTPDQLAQMWKETNVAIAAVSVAGTIPSTVSAGRVTDAVKPPAAPPPAAPDPGAVPKTEGSPPAVTTPAEAAKTTSEGVVEVLKSLNSGPAPQPD